MPLDERPAPSTTEKHRTETPKNNTPLRNPTGADNGQISSPPPTTRLARRHQADLADTVSADKQGKPNRRRRHRPYANTDSSTRSK